MMSDPIADMLTRIRNAQKAGLFEVRIPFSSLKKSIADILSAEGYVGAVSEITDVRKMLVISLKYQGKKPVIQSLVRESKPGHRKYRKAHEIPTVLNGYGFMIVSTPKGLMTSIQARKEGVGGEIICSVY